MPPRHIKQRSFPPSLTETPLLHIMPPRHIKQRSFPPSLTATLATEGEHMEPPHRTTLTIRGLLVMPIRPLLPSLKLISGSGTQKVPTTTAITDMVPGPTMARDWD